MEILNYSFVWALGGIRVSSDTGSSSGLKRVGSSFVYIIYFRYNTKRMSVCYH